MLSPTSVHSSGSPSYLQTWPVPVLLSALDNNNCFFDTDDLASWDSAFAHPIEFLEICGKNGYMRVDNIVEGVSFYPHGDQTATLWKPNIFDTGALTFDKIFENRVHAFVADMAAGREPAPTGLDGLKALQAVEAVIKSFEEKTTVKL